jgi:hypothetical protein
MPLTRPCCAGPKRGTSRSMAACKSMVQSSAPLNVPTRPRTPERCRFLLVSNREGLPLPAHVGGYFCRPRFCGWSRPAHGSIRFPRVGTPQTPRGRHGAHGFARAADRLRPARNKNGASGGQPRGLRRRQAATPPAQLAVEVPDRAARLRLRGPPTIHKQRQAAARPSSAPACTAPCRFPAPTRGRRASLHQNPPPSTDTTSCIPTERQISES